MEYKPLRLEDYFQQPETADPEVLAEAAFAEGEGMQEEMPVEDAPVEYDEHEEGYKYGVNVIGEQADVDALRESIAQELAGLNMNSEQAQEKVRK